MKICTNCGDPKSRYYAKGLCAKCYAISFRRKHGARPAFNWKGHSCDNCGATPVKARGLCLRCYRSQLNKTSPRAMRQRYLANQRKNFGGRRDELLSILGGKCQKCGLTDEQSVERFGRKLDIHHKDGHGRTSDSPNHSEDNLMILCPPCHRLLHITLKKGAAA